MQTFNPGSELGLASSTRCKLQRRRCRIEHVWNKIVQVELGHIVSGAYRGDPGDVQAVMIIVADLGHEPSPSSSGFS
jgi:hypothetical protein